MIANNVVRHRETFCAECGGVTDGGRYCDVCLPKNQTEQEEAYDAEHPMGTHGQETVVCPKPDCLRELHSNTRKRLRASLYNHLATTHLNEYASKREISLAAEALVPTGGSNLQEAAAGWDEQLEDIKRTMMAGLQEGNGRMKKDGNGGALVPKQEKMASTDCPVPGCGNKSFGSDMPHLKASLDAHLRGKHGSMDSKARLALTNKALPGVPWPRKKQKSSVAADTKAQDLSADAGYTETSKDRTVTCTCGRKLRAKSQKSKLTTLVASHLQTKRHEELTDEERLELAKKILPGHSRLRIGGKKAKARAPQQDVEKVVTTENPGAARVPAPAPVESQLFFYDNTDGASVKLPLGGVKQVLSDLVAEQKCRVSVTKLDKMIRAVIEIPEGQI